MKKLILSTLLATGSCFALSNFAYAQQFHSKDYTVICSTDSDNPTSVGCSIKGNLIKHHYQPKEECELDWGQNFSLDAKASKAQIDCASDAYGGGEESKLLKVGQSVKGDGWVCTAIAGDGMKCMTNSQKHGFSLNKSKQVLINK